MSALISSWVRLMAVEDDHLHRANHGGEIRLKAGERWWPAALGLSGREKELKSLCRGDFDPECEKPFEQGIR